MPKTGGDDKGSSQLAVEEAEPTRLAFDAERVMHVIAGHPEGIRLVEIGNELGVDWRGLIGAVKFLMDDGKVEKIDNIYYPAQPGREGE
jgi:hypothetical protein